MRAIQNTTKMSENKLVSQFKKLCKKNINYDFIHMETLPNPPKQHMDVEFIYMNEYIRAEAKYVKNDANWKSQSALNIFGSILKGRNLPYANLKKQKGKEVKYALLLYYENTSDYKKIFQNISNEDWKQFGVNFEVSYVFIVSDKSIKVNKWNHFR